ncbi:MAG: methenyltetrahydromethanopterin cyclohydrolase [Gemmataceae bacterium]|nr:methenyltetrahydromethanopterin cyclohydrolase [Gemmataceae bacterium]MDW8266637.1 methenyltetrahydromethanopterin cyclohydrolase [Gemmataceae bacterium]
MTTTPTLNERANRLADHMMMTAAQLRITTHTIGGARVIDCGIEADGGLQAGLALARVCVAGQAELTLAPGEAAGVPCPLVQIYTDTPVIACLASQYAGWQISVGKFSGMGSGPMRAAYGKEPLFDHIPGREHAPVAVGILETESLPDAAVIDYLADKLKLSPAKLTFLVAPASSIAGNLQVVARSLETALHKLHELKFDLKQVISGFGSAPLPPVATDVVTAIGRTNDAILYGGRVVLWVKADDAQLTELGPKVPSCASKNHGAPFADVLKACQYDFYKIDPALFSPAEVVFHNLKSGKCHAFGRLEPAVLRQSFLG